MSLVGDAEVGLKVKRLGFQQKCYELFEFCRRGKWVRGLLESCLPWLEDPYLSPRGWPLGAARLKSSVFRVGLASGRGQQVVGGQEMREAGDSLPATLAAALVLYCPARSKWEKGKKKKTYWKFPTTLLLHCMWSEPSCLGKPGNIVFFFLEVVVQNKSQSSLSQ